MLQGVKKISFKTIVDNIDKNSTTNSVTNGFDMDYEIYKNGFIRMKLIDKDSTTRVYDDHKNLIEQSNYTIKMVKGVYIKSIIEISGLLIRGADVKIHTKLHQLRVIDERPTKVVLEEYSFVDSESDDDSNDTSTVSKETLEIKYKDCANTHTDYLETEKAPVNKVHIKQQQETIRKESDSKQTTILPTSKNLNEVDKKQEEVIGTIIRLARALNLQIVAEGIETEPQYEFLAAKQVEFSQGYFFSKPLPLEDLVLLAHNGNDLAA
jgi:hypothetical protein